MLKDLIICPGCGVQIYSENHQLDKDFNASAACRDLCYELSYFTLSLRDIYFIHQLVVDTYAAQHSDPSVKPITTAFAIVGLYLVNEKNYTGKQVQQAHMALAKSNQSKIWPHFLVPKDKALLTVQDVVRSPNDKMQEMIKKWCHSVWEIWKPEEEKIAELIKSVI
jgi:hypothetical protein